MLSRSCLLMVLFLGGCLTYQRLPVGEPCRPGDRIRLTMASGSKSEITVKRVEPTTIVSNENRRYDLRYVGSVEVEKVNAARTAVVAVLGSIAALATIVVIAGKSMEGHQLGFSLGI